MGVNYASFILRDLLQSDYMRKALIKLSAILLTIP